MIFIKNILHKDGIKGYLLTLFIIILLSLFFISLSSYLDRYHHEVLNDTSKRTIVVYDSYDCNNNINHIISCEETNDGYLLIVDDYDNMDSVITYLDDNYEILTNDQSNDKIADIIIYVKYITIFLFIICIILIIVIIFQFYRDDISINQILRCIGYSKIKMYMVNTFSYISIITIMHILTYLTYLIIYFLVNINIDFVMVTKLFIIQNIFIDIVILIMYVILFLILNKNRIK